MTTTRRGAELARGLDLPLHVERRTAGAGLVSGTVEQEQDGVATPLDHAGTLGVGDRQQLGEARVEQVVHLLGADLALLRKSLGERGEARDVDEGERARDLANPGGVARAEPIDEQTRHVGSQRFVRRFVD